jgi:hypothetical protein
MNLHSKVEGTFFRVGLAICSIAATSSAQTVAVKVIDDKTGDGVQCEIHKFEEDLKTHYKVGSTDNTGKGTVNDIGKQGQVLRAVNLDYESKEDVPCPVAIPGPLVMEVHRAKHLSKHAEFLLQIGRPAAAAYAFDRACDLTACSQRDRMKAVVALGTALGAKEPVARYGGKTVPSDELVAKVKDLQTREGLTADGRINPQTLLAAVAVEAKSSQ